MKNEKEVIKKECHSRGMLSGIYNACCYSKEGKTLLNRYVEDPRLKPSGMTALFDTPSPRCRRTRPLPQGARGTAHGFTLIELLVVVLIIGILAAVAVPQYRKAVERAKATQGISIVKQIFQAAESYYLRNGIWPTNLEQLDIAIPWEGTTKYYTDLQGSTAKSNREWSIQLYNHEPLHEHAVFVGRISGVYKGTGFKIWKSRDNMNSKTFLRIECREQMDSGIVFNGKRGDYCHKILGWEVDENGLYLINY